MLLCTVQNAVFKIFNIQTKIGSKVSLLHGAGELPAQRLPQPAH